MTIAGYVCLPFVVAGITRDLRVAVCTDEEVDFYLGADFIRAFRAVHDPDTNQLFIRAAGKSVDLEVASIEGADGPHLAAIGLEEMTDEQRQLLNRVGEGR